MYRQKIYEYFKNSKEKNTFFATTDIYAYSKADVIIVDINFDVNKKIKTDRSESPMILT